jgi:DNA-binding transcriptional ArsR family regulator
MEASHPQRGLAQSMLTIILHALLWPGPTWNTPVGRLREAADAARTVLDGFPMTRQAATLLSRAVESHDSLDSMWASSGSSDRSVGASWLSRQGLARDFAATHAWADRAIRNDSIAYDLDIVLRDAIAEAGSDRTRRQAMARLLGDLDCYLFRHSGRGMSMSSESVSELSRWLSAHLLYKHGKITSAPNGLTRGAGFPATRAGMYAVNAVLSRMSRGSTTAAGERGVSPDEVLLRKTREEILRALTTRPTSSP